MNKSSEVCAEEEKLNYNHTSQSIKYMCERTTATNASDECAELMSI